jgi:hypothetical protein
MSNRRNVICPPDWSARNGSRGGLALLILLLISLTHTGLVAADPLSELKEFSQFENINLDRLSSGEVLLARGSFMDFPRGITAQACFIVNQPVGKTLAAFQNLGPMSNEALKIHYQTTLHDPLAESDFDQLDFSSHKPRHRWLVLKTERMSMGQKELFLSSRDVVQMFKCLNAGGDPFESATRCWKEILRSRVTHYQQEGLQGLPLFEAGQTKLSPFDEVQSILVERRKIKNHFRHLLKETIFTKGPGKDPKYYWTITEINKHPALNLGVLYVKDMGTSHQLLDLIYYSTSDVFIAFTLHEVWPIQVGGAEASLVWRGEHVCAPDIASTHGVEKMAAGALMLQEVRKAVNIFRDSVK